MRQDLAQLDERAGVGGLAAVATCQRVRPHHCPVDIVGDVGEKGGAISGLESLENLADAVGGDRVAPSICCVSRPATCWVSPVDAGCGWGGPNVSPEDRK